MTEFFERKKLDNKVQRAIESKPTRTAKRISQDLLALKTVTETCVEKDDCGHDDYKKHNNKINVRMVDLDKLPSGSKQTPQEIDLGPLSPIKRSLLLDVVGNKESCRVEVPRNSGLQQAHATSCQELPDKSAISKKHDIWSNDPWFDSDSYVTPSIVNTKSLKKSENQWSMMPKKSFDLKKKAMNEDFKKTEPVYQYQERTNDSTKHTLSAFEPETPFMKYARGPGQSKVTFSSKITTRTQTPSPLYDSLSNTGKRSSVYSKLDIPLKRHWPIWEQETPILLGKHKNIEKNRFSSMNYGVSNKETDCKQRKEQVSHHQYSSWNKPKTEGFLRNKENKSPQNERNRKRSIALVHEDFQTTPLKKYITKEEYQRKQMEDMEEKRIEKLKLERTKLEKIREKKPLWSVLDDGLFNKLQPSIASLNHKTVTEKSDIDSSETKDCELQFLLDDSKYNKVVATSGWVQPFKEQINANWQSYTSICRPDAPDLIESQNKMISHGTRELQITRHDESFQNMRTGILKENVNLEKAKQSDISRIGNIVDVFKTPLNTKTLDSMCIKPPKTQDKLHNGWMEFVWGKSPSSTILRHKKPPEAKAISYEDTPLIITSGKSAAEEAFEELLCLERDNEKQQQQDLLMEEELILELKSKQTETCKVSTNVDDNEGINIESYPCIGDFQFIEDILETIVTKVCDCSQNSSAKTNSTSYEKKINHSPKNPDNTKSKPTTLSVCVGTDFNDVTLFKTVETQTDVFSLFKDASAQCLILKDSPVTINSFTQTETEKIAILNCVSSSSLKAVTVPSEIHTINVDGDQTPNLAKPGVNIVKFGCSAEENFKLKPNVTKSIDTSVPDDSSFLCIVSEHDIKSIIADTELFVPNKDVDDCFKFSEIIESPVISVTKSDDAESDLNENNEVKFNYSKSTERDVNIEFESYRKNKDDISCNVHTLEPEKPETPVADTVYLDGKLSGDTSRDKVCFQYSILTEKADDSFSMSVVSVYDRPYKRDKDLSSNSDMTESNVNSARIGKDQQSTKGGPNIKNCVSLTSKSKNVMSRIPTLVEIIQDFLKSNNIINSSEYMQDVFNASGLLQLESKSFNAEKSTVERVSTCNVHNKKDTLNSNLVLGNQVEKACVDMDIFDIVQLNAASEKLNQNRVESKTGKKEILAENGTCLVNSPKHDLSYSNQLKIFPQNRGFDQIEQINSEDNHIPSSTNDFVFNIVESIIFNSVNTSFKSEDVDISYCPGQDVSANKTCPVEENAEQEIKISHSHWISQTGCETSFDPKHPDLLTEADSLVNEFSLNSPHFFDQIRNFDDTLDNQTKRPDRRNVMCKDKSCIDLLPDSEEVINMNDVCFEPTVPTGKEKVKEKIDALKELAEYGTKDLLEQHVTSSQLDNTELNKSNSEYVTPVNCCLKITDHLGKSSNLASMITNLKTAVETQISVLKEFSSSQISRKDENEFEVRKIDSEEINQIDGNKICHEPLSTGCEENTFTCGAKANDNRESFSQSSEEMLTSKDCSFLENKIVIPTLYNLRSKSQKNK